MIKLLQAQNEQAYPQPEGALTVKNVIVTELVCFETSCPKSYTQSPQVLQDLEKGRLLRTRFSILEPLLPGGHGNPLTGKPVNMGGYLKARCFCFPSNQTADLSDSFPD